MELHEWERTPVWGPAGDAAGEFRVSIVRRPDGLFTWLLERYWAGAPEDEGAFEDAWYGEDRSGPRGTLRDALDDAEATFSWVRNEPPLTDREKDQ